MGGKANGKNRTSKKNGKVRKAAQTREQQEATVKRILTAEANRLVPHITIK